MALWQTGVSWAPSTHMTETNYNGALEHIARHFGEWAQRILRARKGHQEDPDTKNAQRRSGANTGQHGLTEEELELRNAKNKARVDFYLTKDLHNQIPASNGKGGGRGKGNAKGTSHPPKAYHQFTPNRKWWLDQLWSGKLGTELDQAEKLGVTRVQAKDFNVFDYD